MPILKIGTGCSSSSIAPRARPKGWDLEHRLLMSDGSVKHLHAVAHAVHDQATGGTEYVGAVMDVTAAKESRQALEKAYAEIQGLKDQLQRGEHRRSVRRSTQTSMFEEIVGTSPPLRTCSPTSSKVAPTDSTVLITGETGTGKELVARAIHQRSPRSSRPARHRQLRGDSRRRSSRRSSSATRRARSPAPLQRRRVASSSPTAGRSSSTRSANCRPRRSQRCCACSRSASSSASAAADRSASTSGSLPPRTVTCGRRSPTGAFRRGPLLPAQRVPARVPAAARAPRRYPAARRVLHPSLCRSAAGKSILRHQ